MVIGKISKYRHENTLYYTTERVVGISAALKEKGMDVSASGVHYLLKELGYNLGRNKKNHNISAAEAQFAHINRMANACMKRGEAILFIEVKRVDKRWRNRMVVEYDHDYLAEELGKETPSAFYNLFKKQGFVNLGLDNEMSRVVIGCMEQWFKTEYFERYRDAKRILVVTDALVSEGWVSRLQALVNQINKRIEVLYFPQGITKWDNVKHRFYSFIGDDPQEQFVHTAIIGSLIGEGNGTGVTVEYVTNTKAGTGEEESNNLPAGIIDFMEGEWNYTLWPAKRGGIRKTPGLRIEGAEYFQETGEDEGDMDDEEPSDDEEIGGDEEGDKMVNDEKVSNG
jgi:hypothetical protein